MAGPYTITTPVKGQPVPSSGFGQAVKDAINDLHTRVATLETGADPVVRLVQRAAQSIVSATATQVQYGSTSTDYDTHSFHSETTNNTRVTPTIPGYYRVHATASFGTGSGNYTQVSSGVAKNGTRVDPQDLRRPDPGTAACTAYTTAVVTSNGTTDYFEGWASQNSTGAQNTNTSSGFRCVLEVSFVRPL